METICVYYVIYRGIYGIQLDRTSIVDEVRSEFVVLREDMGKTSEPPIRLHGLYSRHLYMCGMCFQYRPFVSPLSLCNCAGFGAIRHFV